MSPLGFVLALALAAGLVLLTWWSYRAFVRPLAALVASTRRLLEGSDARPAPFRGWALGGLASSLELLASRAESRLAAVEAEREHLLAVLGSMSEGVLVTDAEGQPVLVNPRWRQLVGVPDDAETASAAELARYARIEQLIEETLGSGRGGQEEIELTAGEPRTLVVASSPLRDGSGVVVLARDVTDLLRLVEVRRELVANLSHELRTPLAAIRGFAETLVDGALEDREVAAGFLDRILQQCRRLEALLSDLLMLSRLESPAGEREREAVDLAKTVRAALDVVADGARRRGIRVESHLEPVPAIEGDPQALERLCLNLLENAVKYNRPEGSVDVHLQPVDGQIVLEVRDTGIGIPKGLLERVFERFYRVDKGRSRREGGTGLGLAIVKHAAQVHGGRVEVESRLGQGSVFRVIFPHEL